MTAPLTIALTGGIGSGKSTVADLFVKLGAPVIDADLIARELVQPDKPILKQIVTEFGPDILLQNQQLDRKKLANIIFNGPAAERKFLENLLHPAIYSEIDRQIETIKFPYCLVVIPLLIETGAVNHFGRVLVSDVTQDIQISRTMNRDNASKNIVRKIITAQADREERLAHADDIIDNNATMKELEQAILVLHEKYLSLAAGFTGTQQG